MEKKKVLFVANLDSFFTKFLIPQLKFFKDKGYEVHVASKNENLNIPYIDKKFDVDFARSLSLRDNIVSYKQVKKILANECYEIISCHTPFGGAMLRYVAKKIKLDRSKTKIVYMAHGFHFYKGAPLINWLLYYNVEKYLANYTDVLITMNLDDYEIATKKFHTNVKLVKGVGLNAGKFDIEMTDTEKESFRKNLGLKNNDFVMVYSAELLPRKRQVWLINAISDLLKKNNHFKLLLLGRDSMHGKVQKLITKKGLDKQIIFLGFRSDVPQILKSSNLALAASKQEGLPVHIMEAMYVGLPVVATDCRGNRDLVENGKNGYIVGLNDAKTFNEKIIMYSKMTEKEFANISKINKEKINDYTIDSVINEIMNCYDL